MYEANTGFGDLQFGKSFRYCFPNTERLEDAHNRYLNMTPEERRDCRPQSKLRYWGTQKSLYDYCDKYHLVEGKSYLYVLKCAEDLYYIGETNGIFQRFREHFAPSGKSAVSATVVYEPQSVYEIIPLGEMGKSQRLLYEDALTVEYANKYTIYQVRGGHFSHHDIQKAYSAKKLQSHWLYEKHGRLRFLFRVPSVQRPRICNEKRTDRAVGLPVQPGSYLQRIRRICIFHGC